MKARRQLQVRIDDDWQWLNAPVEVAARRLLGCELTRELNGQLLRAKIVEVEAYDQADPASHTYRGQTASNAAMFLAAGHAYVYLIHGMHHCLNLVTGVEGYGSGVLVRAVEPLDGVEAMELNRRKAGLELTNGPGKVCQALGIIRELTGHDLSIAPLQLIKRTPVPDSQIIASPRIGISKATREMRRFYISGNPYVSKVR